MLIDSIKKKIFLYFITFLSSLLFYCLHQSIFQFNARTPKFIDLSKQFFFFRSYLRSREDTVRSVVSSLLDDSPSELADELNKGECLQLDDGSADDETTEDWEKWMPDPVDADPGKLSCNDYLTIEVKFIYS